MAKRAKFALFIMLFGMLVLCSNAAVAATIYVPDNYATIQPAINAAKNGDTVVVRDGTYKGSANQNLDFKGKAITVRSRNGAKNCIIDCEKSGRGFIFQTGETANSVLSGFTIINGKADNGGGIALQLSSPTIKGCIITGNTATDNGGGIAFEDSSPIISNCTIAGNVASTDGGGIAFEDSAPTISNCTIKGNMATFDGGGIAFGDSAPTISNCTIVGNKATWRGGGIFSWSSSPSISDCNITGNTAIDEGGGISMSDDDASAVIKNSTISANTSRDGGGIAINNSSPSITSCCIAGNKTPGNGGGIYCMNESSPNIRDCVITGNTATYNGGGIYCLFDSSPKIRNCAITGNDAFYGGGGIALELSSPTITGCSIAGNEVANYGGGIYCSSSHAVIANSIINGNTAWDRTWGDGDGGGIYCTSSSPIITNCTLTGNTASPDRFSVGGISCNFSSPKITNCILWADSGKEVYLYRGKPAVTYCNIQGGYAGTGNINADPFFEDPKHGDFHPKSDSPCLDKGINTAPKIPTTDKNGKPRIANSIVDMGAYEYNGLATPPIVSISSSDPAASEPGTDIGSSRVCRTGDTSTPLTINYSAGGTATNGEDYQKRAGSVVINTGLSAARIYVMPTDDTVAEPEETVMVTLLVNDDYEIGSPASATVTIADND